MELVKPKKAIVPGGYVSPREMWAFGIGGVGQNMIYTLMSTFILFFYTEAYGLTHAHAGIIIAIARVWDAINDTIMGTVVDRTKHRLGKFRFYLLLSPMLIGIATVLIFITPSANYTVKFIWAIVTYLIWDFVYTISDIPYWGLSAAISPLPEERAKFLQFARVICTVGAASMFLIAPELFKAFGGELDPQAYFKTALVVGLGGGAIFLLPGIFCRDKIVTEKKEKPRTFKENLLMVKDNKPLLMVLIAGVIGFCRSMAQVAGTYIAVYNFHGQSVLGITGLGLMTVIAAGFGIGMFIGMLAMPALQKKFDFKSLFIWSSVFAFVVQIIMFFVGYSSIIAVIVGLFFAGLPFGVYNVLTYAMISDSVQYYEWKKGERVEGFSFSLQTFMTKIASGLATLVTTGALTLGGFISATNGSEPILQGVEIWEQDIREGRLISVMYAQSDSALGWLFALVSIIPAISCLLSIIPIFFYPLDRKQMDIINKDLAARREQQSAAQADSQQAVPAAQ